MPESKSAAKLDQVLSHIDKNLGASLKRVFALLRVPSVGTDPKHKAHCRKAAEWLMNELKSMGFDASLRETTGQPVVLATYVPPNVKAGKSKHQPHVLFYGHYDVQPSEPDDLWTTPPYAPQIRKSSNGRDAIFARGSADDKGQVMTFVEASRAWLKLHKSLPCRLTVLIEGDEEGDFSHFDRFVENHRKLLKADVALVCDSNLWDEKTPSITTQLRGCIAEEVFIHGPRIDLHSGYFGGPAVNPIKALSRIIAALHDKNGRVTIPGFYDGIRPLTAAERKRLKTIPFKEAAFLKAAGLKQSAGEKGFSVLEQVWMRPTCEVNGINGGYTQPGEKTVLPAVASAKFTFRLVDGQNPSTISRAFHQFVRTQLLPDCKASFAASRGGSSGIRVTDSSPWIDMGKKVLKDEWGRAPVMSGDGGSIPAVESFKRHLGIDSLMIGFGLSDDRTHSPDEKYDVRSFHKATRTWARLLSTIAERNSR